MTLSPHGGSGVAIPPFPAVGTVDPSFAAAVAGDVGGTDRKVCDLTAARGAETGSLRGDVEPEDIAVMLVGILLTTVGGSSEQTERLPDLMLDALRLKTTS